MTAQKQAEAGAAHSTPETSTPASRKPWKKKTPVQAVLDQISRLREGLAEKEEELKRTKQQLQKLEEVKKLLETT